MFTRKKKRNEEPEAKQQPVETENELKQSEEISEKSSEESSDESSAKSDESEESEKSNFDDSKEAEETKEADEAGDAKEADEADKAVEIDEEELLKALEEMGPEGFADVEKEAVASLALRILEEGKMGAFSKETLEMLHGAVALERMVAEADKEGEIRGRNAQIEEQVAMENSDDGLPHLSSISGASPRRVASIFDLAREA